MTTLTTSTLFEPLHLLRIKGFTSDAAFAHMLGVTEQSAAGIGAPLLEAGLVRRREGRLSGTMLTPEGAARHAELLAERLSEPGYRTAFEVALELFRPVNSGMKQLCMRWQQRPDGTPNLHDDAAYDDEVISAIADVDARVQQSIAEAERMERRMQRYTDRLGRTLARLRSGEAPAFLRPMSESYHDIWMELHEDLLLSSGRARGDDDEG